MKIDISKIGADIGKFGSGIKSKVADKLKAAKGNTSDITEADTAGITAEDAIAEAAVPEIIEQPAAEQIAEQVDDDVLIAAASEAEASGAETSEAEAEVKAESEAVAEVKAEAKKEPKAKRSFTVDANTVRSAWLIECAAAVLTSAVAVIVACVF